MSLNLKIKMDVIPFSILSEKQNNEGTQTAVGFRSVHTMWTWLSAGSSTAN